MTYVNGGSVIAIGVLFPILGIAGVISRFHVRVTRKQSLGVDDWLCLAALLLEIGCGITMVIGASGHAIGHHSAPQDDTAFFQSQIKTQIFLEKCEYAFDILQVAALGFVKLSILFFYRRIFRGRIFDIVSWALIAVVSAWTVAFFLDRVFNCRNLFSANWGTIGELLTECSKPFEQLLALSISDVVVDVFILTLPVPFVWRLQMPLRRKVAVCGIFMLGAFAVTASIVRMVIFIEIFAPSQHSVKDPTVLGVPSTDDIGVVSIFLFWAMVEVGVAVIAASLPTLRPLFQGFSPESVINSLKSVVSLRSLRSESDGHNEHERRSSTSSARRLKGSNGVEGMELRHKEIGPEV